MELFAYEPLLTTDGVRPVPGAVVGFYADTDTGFKAPLEVFTLEGKSLGFSPVADKNGYINNAGGYMLPVQYGKSKSGKLPAVPVFSVRSVIADAKSAASSAAGSRTAAEAAAAAAQAPADQAVDRGIQRANLPALIAAGTPVALASEPSATGDDTSGLRDLLAANAGTSVALRPGRTYKITGQLDIPSNTTLDLNGSVLDCRGMAAGTTLGQRFAIKSTGSLDATLPVSARLQKWGRTLSGISSTTGLTAGDLVLIVNEERPIPGMTRAALKKAELNTIRSVDSPTQVTLTSGAIFDYGAVSLTVRKVKPVMDVTIRNGRILMGGTGSAHNAVNIRYGRGVTIEGLVIEGAEDQAIGIQTVWGANISHNIVRNSTSSVTLGNTGYGVAITEAASHIVVSDNEFDTCRHFITGGGAWPAVYVDVRGNHGRASSDYAYDCHEPTLYWNFTGNTATGVAGGLIIRGQHITVSDNVVTDSPGVGIRCYTFDGVTEQVGLRVAGNRITNCAGGIEVDGKNTGGDTVDSVRRDVTVTNNHVREITFTGIRVRHFRGATVSGNYVHTVAGEDGIQVEGLSVSAPSEDLVMSDNQVHNVSTTSRYGIRVTSVQNAEITNAHVVEGGAAGITLESCFDMSVTGCRSRRSASMGIRVDGGARVNITGGAYTDTVSSVGDGVRVINSSDVSITGTLTKNPRSGIYITGTNYVLVSGNNARANGAGSKINIDASATSKIDANNMVA